MKTKLITTVAATLVALLFTGSLQADSKRGKRGGKNREERRQKMLEKFDADGDGKLNKTERAQAREEMKKRRGNRNGQGQRGQGQRGQGQRGQGQRGQGQQRRPRMSKEEFMKKFDINNDGKLDNQERASAREQMQRMRGNRGQGQRGERGQQQRGQRGQGQRGNRGQRQRGQRGNRGQGQRGQRGRGQRRQGQGRRGRRR